MQPIMRLLSQVAFFPGHEWRIGVMEGNVTFHGRSHTIFILWTLKMCPLHWTDW